MTSQIKAGMKMSYPGKKGKFEVVEVKFNPIGAPNSNRYYCRCKADPYHCFREDVAMMLSGMGYQTSIEFTPDNP